jgi:hypothetical protein
MTWRRRGSGGIAPPLLTSTLYWGERSVSRRSRLALRREPPVPIEQVPRLAPKPAWIRVWFPTEARGILTTVIIGSHSGHYFLDCVVRQKSTGVSEEHMCIAFIFGVEEKGSTKPANHDRSSFSFQFDSDEKCSNEIKCCMTIHYKRSYKLRTNLFTYRQL